MTKVKDLLANRDSADPEEIKKEVSELQQASLKLFEMAYKKVSHFEKRSTRKKRYARLMNVMLFIYLQKSLTHYLIFCRWLQKGRAVHQALRTRTKTRRRRRKANNSRVVG